MTQRFSFILWLMAGLAAFVGPAAAQAPAPIKVKSKIKPLVTTIYIVRHAEKDSTSDRADPTLSPLGQTRALALRQTLLRHHPAALFTTDTKRTRATLAPLAEALKLEPQTYDPKRGRDLADRILKEYAGKSVVIVGHSNTVLSLIDDFGATPPVEEIGEQDYEYLFTVRVAEGLMPTVDMRGYGPERRPGIKIGKATPMAPVPPVK
ncbi:phosphoglycerate mutase family protein [Hymenobacter negativus]|uniref:Histidine phosphatase family protein n=1 Tax=Hymenobacter negativus TaxID=2795026 RepID=A0ABS0Q2N2_9BACT|nr:phosphoglycerate mutase family protein [Hymenobacter negativus]MBH8556905.1 histidine phosphatase family protein [Hymenobacter negativus]